jgi:hypothetical protein
MFVLWARYFFGFSSDYNANTYANRRTHSYSHTNPNRYTHTYSDANPHTDSVAFT